MTPSESPSDRSIYHNLRARLGVARLAYAIALSVAVALFSMGLKGFQIAGLDDAIGFAGLMELMRSEIFVTVAFASLALATAALLSRRAVYLAGAGLLQLFAAYTVFANIIGYYFFAATGSALNWRIFRHGLSALRESPQVIHSEVPVLGWVILAIGLVLTALVPPVLAWWLHRRNDGGDDAPDTRRAPSYRLGIACSVVAALSLLIAAIPTADADQETGFARNQGLHMMITALIGSPSVDADTVEPWFDIADIRIDPIDDSPPENVAFIILESVRASATTPYHPDLETTPYLDDLAAQSELYEQAYAMVPHTSKALIAMLCGAPPRILMEIAESRPGGSPGQCLPTVLGDQGYRSVFMQSATERFEARRGLVANMGFDDFIPLERMDTEGYDEANYFGYEDDIMLPYSEQWLQAQQQAPFLATYLTITPHHDYRAPETYGHFEFHEHTLFNRYLNSVRYIDHFLENLIDQYKALGLYESTLFVIAGDHGEAFGEHGREQHDNVPWQEGIHIPLLIHDGSQSQPPQRRMEPVSHIDLVPTILARLGFDVVEGDYPGYVTDEIPEGRIVFFSCWYDEQCAGFLHEGHKYIHHYGNRRDELFHIIDDPGEQTNLLADTPGRVEEPQSLLFDWTESVAVAYDHFFREVINRRVLADAPGLRHSLAVTVSEAVKVTGYEWRDVGPDTHPELVIGLQVLRDFRISDSATIVLDGGSQPIIERPAMRGVFPDLFWQEGQYMLEIWPGELFESLPEGEKTLRLVIGDESGEILSFQEGAHH